MSNCDGVCGNESVQPVGDFLKKHGIVAIEEIDTSRTRWVGRIVVELTLTEPRTGAVLWTEQFDETEPLTTQTPEGLARALLAAALLVLRARAEVEHRCEQREPAHEPEADEQALYERISAFLQKEDSYALPKQQRHLTALILRKLLASSSHAVAATLVILRFSSMFFGTTLRKFMTSTEGADLVKWYVGYCFSTYFFLFIV